MENKVAVIFDLSEPGGVQTCVWSLVKGLNSKGLIPDLYWDVPPAKKLLEESRVSICFKKWKFIFPSRLIKKFPYSIRYLLWPFNMIKASRFQGKYDFIYSFTTLFQIDIPCRHLIFLSGPPLLPQLESRKISFKILKGIYCLFLKRPFPVYVPQAHAEYVINAEYTAGMFFAAYKRRLKVVYPSNQLPSISFDINDLESRDTITFFSRIADYKRPDKIFHLAKAFPKLRFVVMGGVTRTRVRFFNKLKKQACNMGLANIEFIPNAEIVRINLELARSRIYFFPAVNEHFGITTVEAIAAGCIPFVHDSGGQKEIVPFEVLRWSDTNCLNKFRELVFYDYKQLNHYRELLCDHLEKFSEQNYINKMLSFMEPGNHC